MKTSCVRIAPVKAWHELFLRNLVFFQSQNNQKTDGGGGGGEGWEGSWNQRREEGRLPPKAEGGGVGGLHIDTKHKREDMVAASVSTSSC